MKENKNVGYITFIQVIAAFAVLELHTNGCFWYFDQSKNWFGSNIQECLFYFAVPVFFMTTGITLIDYPDRYSMKTYFKKRATKTVIPFLAWSVIGVAYGMIVTRQPVSELNIGDTLRSILNNEVISIFWFFTPLFCVYLCIPLFAAVRKENRNAVFTYLLIAGFIINSLLPFVDSVVRESIKIPLSISVISGYLLYAVGGVVLHENPLGKKQRIIVYILGVAGLLMHIIGTYKLSVDAGEIVGKYKGYNNVPCILYSFAIFCMLRETGTRIMNTKLKSFIKTIGKYTFSIYLMQYFIMDIAVHHMTMFHLKNVNVYSEVYRWFAPFVIIAVIMGITYVIRKIPVLNKIVP